MAARNTALIPEIREQDATGGIVRVYGEIRRDFAVPMVSTVYRHLATIPGCLEWIWATLAPAVRCGDFQGSARVLACAFDAEALPPVAHLAIRAMGVDAPAEMAIRDVYQAYNRSNPLNLLFAFVLKTLLSDGPGIGPYTPRTDVWSPPAPLGRLVEMVQPEDMAPELADLAGALGFRGFPSGQRWVPGVYRHLANWPAYLAHVGAVLLPRLESGALAQAGVAMIDGARDAAVELARCLPPPGTGFQPPRRDKAEALAAVLDSLIPNIPEMVVACTLLTDALPPLEHE